MQLKIVGRGPMREYVSCVHEMNGNDSSSNLYSFLMPVMNYLDANVVQCYLCQQLFQQQCLSCPW